MITSCNHSATEQLCGSCREKNHRQSILDDKDAEVSFLCNRVARLEEALRFILDECDWEESMQHACGDNKIGTAARRALEEK